MLLLNEYVKYCSIAEKGMMVYVSVENFHAWGILSTPDSLKIHGAPRVEIFEGSICRAGSEKIPDNLAPLGRHHNMSMVTAIYGRKK